MIIICIFSQRGECSGSRWSMTEILNSSHLSAGHLDDSGLHQTIKARRDSFKTLYQNVGEELVEGLRNRFGDGPPEPEDLAQEAFRRAIDHPEWSRISNKRAFIWRTAINLAVTNMRTTTARTKYEPDIRNIYFAEEGDNSTPETVLLVKEQLDAIRAALEAMPERRRWALLLRRVQGLTQREVAIRLGISRSAVAKHLARADKEISQLFLDDSEG